VSNNTVFVTRHLCEAGFTYDEIRRDPHLRHLRRGAWIGVSDASSRLERYVQLIKGTYGNLPSGGVLAHASAAALHGLPVPYDEMGQVHVLRPPRHWSFRARYVRAWTALIPDHDVTHLEGLPVTSLARTVADVTRTWNEAWAVAAADAALGMGLALHDLQDQLVHPHGLGGPQARRVAAFADPLSGSAGESLSRYYIHQAGLPMPRLQGRFPWSGGVDITDFDWELAGGVVGEFDGYGKYVRLQPDGTADPAKVAYAEKRREDRLRTQVSTVVRWGWQELMEPSSFLVPLAAALTCTPRPLGILSRI
jgi:hypothetical protein